MNRLVTWLHLSDLHARQRDDWDSRTITKKLVDDLKSQQKEHGLRPDFLFFTGDAVFGAANGEKMPDQYQLTRTFLEAVRKAFDPEIPLRDIYLVPGNHDVDRGEISPAETAWLRDPTRKLEDVMSPMRDKTKQWRNWMDRLASYKNFLTSYGLLHLKPDDPHLIWADSREIAGVRIGIAGLNSAWSCADNQDKANLWCGAKWQISQVKERMGPVDFAFALIHHPGNWFNDREDPQVMRQLRREFPLVLHGHEHQDWVEADGDGQVVISAGACYQASWMANGYNFGQIDLDSGKGKVWLREWDDSGGGWVPRNISGKTNHGIWPLNHLPWLSKTADNPDPAASASTAAVEDESPAPGLTAEEHYTQRFCKHVVDQHDVLELFGCDIPRELQKHQLSIAYVSLNLSSEREEEGLGLLPPSKGDIQPPSDNETARTVRGGESSTSLESLLDKIAASSNRLMIRGPAGAGKSTLMRWCAIHAARQVLESPSNLVNMDRFIHQARAIFAQNKSETGQIINILPSWRRKIPILIRLRDCPNGKLPAASDIPRFLAKHLPTAPAEWMTGILEAGRALVLFDGVDEVHRDQRRQLAEEMGELIRTYPDCTYVVTTRPGAVERGWLDRLKFVEARVESMGRTDREEFIDKWYRSAALELKHRPRPGEDLTQTAARLKNELTDQPELGVLASNPLLCAMICALYRERQESLPETPADLCEALVQMLLHRREYETPGLGNVHFPAAWRALQYPQKKGLLAELAWKMVSQNASSIEEETAEQTVHEVLSSTPGQKPEDSTEILQALVERSGLLRPAGDERVDFLHNTLKEYLAAGKIVENGGWEFLVQRASDPAWQPVILFTLALAPEPFSSGLVRQLLATVPATHQAIGKKAARKPNKKEQIALTEANKRNFFLVRCRTAAKRLASDLSAQIDALTARLLPPAHMHEVEILAQLGPRILLYSDATLSDPKWWRRQESFTITRCLRLLRLVGGQRAKAILASINDIPGYSSQVTGEWMLASSELFDSTLPWPFRSSAIIWMNKTRVNDLRPLKGLLSVAHLRAEDTSVSDLAPLINLIALQSLHFSGTQVSDLSPLAGLRALQSLHFGNTQVSDLSPLVGLRALQSLILWDTQVSDLSPLANLSVLQNLDLSYTPVNDLSPLTGLSVLQKLDLRDTQVRDLSPLAGLRALHSLHFSGTQVSDLSPLVGLRALQSLTLWDTQVSDLSPLANLSVLQNLDLSHTPVNDLSPLTGLSVLQKLDLRDTQVRDLSSLVGLTELKHIYVVRRMLPAENLERFKRMRPDILLRMF